MKYFKLFLMWCGFITMVSLFGEHVISREVNGFLQLLGFVGLFGVLMYLGGETIKILTKNKTK